MKKTFKIVNETNGVVSATGLTLKEARTELARRLKNFRDLDKTGRYPLMIAPETSKTSS